MLLGHNPAGTLLPQFYLTKQDCLTHLTRTENDPLIGSSATEAGRFRLDCVQLTEANEKIGEPRLPHSRVRPLAKRRHHPTRPPAPIQDWNLSSDHPLRSDQSAQKFLNEMHRVDAYQMVRRRTIEAGLKGKLGCHVFRRSATPPISRPLARSKTPRKNPPRLGLKRPRFTTDTNSAKI